MSEHPENEHASQPPVGTGVQPSTPQGEGASSEAKGLDPDTPAGAIAVTVFLAATILVFWFGMFFLNLARSG